MDKLVKFWQLIVDVWEKGLFGVGINRFVVAIVIVVLFLFIRRLFSTFVIKRLAKFLQKKDVDIDESALNILEKPFSFIPVALGLFLATQYLSLSGEIQLLLDRFIRSLIVFVIFWSLFKLIDPLSIFLRKLEKTLTPSLMDWLIKAINIFIIFVGAATILEIWGIKIGPILAGLGLFGVAVALGAQDLFKNLISGILIIGERRFNPGDWIKIDGLVEGTVETIGFRSTKIRRFDKAPVFVPNSNLSDSSVINFSNMTHRRIYWMIGVEYRTTVDQLRQIRDNIESYILNSEDFARPPEVPTFVRIDRFSDSSIDIMVYCFTKTTVWGEWLQIKEKLAYKIKEIVKTAETAFAFPSQSVYVESLPTDKAEVFVPPSDTKIEPGNR
ncbi:MAG: mechanosensitive ion channel family protein [Deltaproteobacteria bacterium]|nr:mechanosensitive ion channel family protein [Deltaproteobacteria bacterium]MBW1813618.1 mechanosensitive ion channel family protein [Deltaproteobacteria bacterium]MBW1847526.1 mechanosensitive ion channel family protein [Deltaproteobacteria bacterium]MBW1984171.1 mechanosensitive ion channel family protein [Deltaproteobacteria bacterium]MBW2179761.1 mechanosensitive ion channel family protein [Deltaproteobacteria bacterium]